MIRYNQIYHIKSKEYDKIMSFRDKIFEFKSTSSKFTYQYSLFFTPTFTNKKMTLLNSEIEEFTNKQQLM